MGVCQSRQLDVFECKKANFPFGSEHIRLLFFFFLNITFAETCNFPLQLQLFNAQFSFAVG